MANKITKKKHPKMDPKLIAKNEIGFIRSRYKIPVIEIKKAIAAVGISRTKTYDYLRANHPQLPKKRVAKKKK